MRIHNNMDNTFLMERFHQIIFITIQPARLLHNLQIPCMMNNAKRIGLIAHHTLLNSSLHKASLRDTALRLFFPKALFQHLTCLTIMLQCFRKKGHYQFQLTTDCIIRHCIGLFIQSSEHHMPGAT